MKERKEKRVFTQPSLSSRQREKIKKQMGKKLDWGEGCPRKIKRKGKKYGRIRGKGKGREKHENSNLNKTKAKFQTKGVTTETEGYKKRHCGEEGRAVRNLLYLGG